MTATGTTRDPAPDTSRRGSWMGELTGGVTGALIAFSVAVPVGALMVAPLGPGASGIGVFAGLVGAGVGTIVASVLGSTPILRSGPSTATAIIISALVASLMVLPEVQEGGQTLATVLALAFVAVALGGVLQIVFGALRLGEAIKFVPRPVVTGFRNSLAILIVLTQLPPLLGVERLAVLVDGGLAMVIPSSIAVGMTAVAAVYAMRRAGLGSIALFVGLATGTVMHHAIHTLVPAAAIGTTVAPLPSLANLGAFAPLGMIPAVLAHPWVLLSVFAPALTIALVGSLLSLLALRIVEERLGEPADANRELVAQGLGNLTAGALGGVPIAGAPANTTATYHAGGRTRWTSFVSTVMLLACAAGGGTWVAMLPLAAVAGLMLVLAADLLDAELLHLCKDARRRGAIREEALADLGIIAAVAATCLVVNIVAGVVLGFVISATLFVLKSSRKIVRRRSTGDARSSLRQRATHEAAILRTHGAAIVLLELEGPVFFGTADRLAREIRDEDATARYVILDFARVNAIDATGANVVAQIGRRLAAAGRHLVIAALAPGDSRRLSLERAGQDAAIEWHLDADRALEWCEERVLEAWERVDGMGGELPLERMEVCRELKAGEIALLHKVLYRERYSAGTVLFREDDPGDCMYLLAWGSVSITIGSAHAPAAGRRVATFAPGVAFGELAVLEGRPRSAHAVFDTDAVVYVLTRDQLARLAQTEPNIVIKIYIGLSIALAQRLRETTRELRLLAVQ